MSVGDYNKMLSQSHKAFVSMGIDAIFYLNDINFTASHDARLAYVELFNRRRVKNIIFITQTTSGFEFVMAPVSGNNRLIKDGDDAFYLEAKDLYTLLLNVGKEVRRADQAQENFLIPEKPNVIRGLSIVENTLLKNYPGILRRSKLAVERFALLDSTNINDDEVLKNVKHYNKSVCLLYTSPSPRDLSTSRMPSSA